MHFPIRHAGRRQESLTASAGPAGANHSERMLKFATDGPNDGQASMTFETFRNPEGVPRSTLT